MNKVEPIDMQKSLLLLFLFLLPLQIVWAQVKKQEISKYPSDKFVILSCQPNLNITKVLNGRAVKLIKPLYLKHLIETEKRGAVNVQIRINEKGKVISASAVSGYAGFHQAAVEAVRKSKFKRFIRCGKLVKVAGTVVYNFIPPE